MCLNNLRLKGPFLVLFLVWLVIAVAASTADAGERFVLTSHGEGDRTLVMIPGLASSDALWQPWVERYRVDYRVITVQIAGFADGKNAEPWPGLPALADELAARLNNSAENDQFVLVGHSLGGQLALQLATRLPDKVGQVMVIDSLPFFARLYNPSAEPDFARRQAAMMAQNFRAMNEQSWHSQQASGMQRLTLNADMQNRLAAWSRQSDRALVIDAMEELMASDYRPILEKVEAEVLVLMAHDDSMGVTRESLAGRYTRQYERLPSFELLSVDEAYHFLMVDQPSAFTQIFDRWLSCCEAAGSVTAIFNDK